MEIKHSTSPSLSRGFYIACDDVKPQRRYVLYSGKDRFPFGKGITAISLPELMQEIQKQA